MKTPPERMFDAAERACKRAKEAIVDEAEREFPEEGSVKERAVALGRQIGAILTAATLLYRDALHTVVNSENQGEAQLLAGHLKNMLAEPLGQIAMIADGKYQENGGANENSK